MRPFLGSCLALATLLGTAQASADASSWVGINGGAARLQQPFGVETTPGLMQLDLGVGTSPSNAFVLGGLLRSSTYFGDGTDLALMSRMTTGGFSRGDYGLALDLGVAQRWWGPSSTALAVSLDAGAPWGLTLGLNGSFAPDSVMTIGLVVGIDFARFTVHRRSGSDWWPNYPLPLSEAASERGLHAF
jgi:hypothetical protein